jgi:ATP-binding cassette, subfamily B, bacterial MsbA
MGKKKKRNKEQPKLSFWETLRISRGMYRRLFHYIKPYKWRFIGGIGFGILFAAANSALPWAMFQVSSFIFHGAMPNPKNLLKHREMLTTGTQIDSIVWICLLIPLVMIVRSIFDFLNGYYLNWVSSRVIHDIRNELFSKMMRHSMDFFNRTRIGFLMSRIANDTRSMQIAFNTISADIFKHPATILGSVAMLLAIDWKFTIVTLILFPTCLIPIRLLGRRARRAVESEQKGMAQMNVTMQETFAGIRVVKSFAREPVQEKSFRRTTSEQFSNQMRMTRMMQAIGPIVEVVASVGAGLALFYVYFAQLPAAKFIALLSGMFLLYEPIKMLSKLHIVMQRSVGATSKIFSLLDLVPSIQDAPNANTLTNVRGEILFDNVTFRYSTGVANALDGITLRVEPGKTYALVGPSGAGKSTILSLILRMYDPTSGAVKIDNHDLRTLTQQSLREQIGLVTQETFLFHDSIFKNIQFGRLDATPEEVYAAAETAFAHDFITAQPKGYDTVIGDKGCMLSGGQQQRLAIARALLKNAPILLLDEATSALDSESEKQIQRALERLAAGRTVIAIAHRLSTILSADQIVVMDQGRIHEIGTHAELLDKSGHYRRLYDLQFNRPTEPPHPESTPEPDVLEEELV